MAKSGWSLMLLCLVGLSSLSGLLAQSCPKAMPNDPYDTADNDIEFLANLYKGNVSSFADNEWIIAYLTASCPICAYLDPIIDQLLSEEGFESHLKIAKILMYPMLTEDTEDPLIYHIKNGFVRQYRDDIEYEKLANFLKNDVNWNEAKKVVEVKSLTEPSETSLWEDFTAEVFNLVRGTLVLVALILVFAWVVDLCTSKKEHLRRGFRANENVLPEIEPVDDILDDGGLKKTPRSESPKAKGPAEKSPKSKSKPLYVVKNMKKNPLNPFSSTDSLIECKDEAIPMPGPSTSTVGVVKESVEERPMAQQVLQIPQVQETKIEQFQMVTKENDSNEAEPATEAPNAVIEATDSKKIEEIAETAGIAQSPVKMDTLEVEELQSQEAVTIDAKLQQKQETIIVKPVVQEELHLEPKFENNKPKKHNQKKQNKKNDGRKESKC